MLIRNIIKIKMFLIFFIFIISCKTGNVIIFKGKNPKPIDEVFNQIKADPKTKEEMKKELLSLHKMEDKKYVIHVGDIFNIYFDADENFNTLDAIVKSDGYISIKRLGEVRIAGLKINEAKTYIEKKMRNFIKISPKLSIIPVHIKESRINILGEVRNPGSYPIVGNMKILDIISLAGGIANLVLENERIENAELDLAYIYREDRILPVDFTELILKGNPLHNILVKDKDYIYIPSASSKQVYVLGEVNSPGRYMVKKFYTITKLIAEANGIRDSSSSNILIVRGHLNNPLIYKVNIDAILKRGINDFLLKPDDIVYAPKSGITKYNDVINKILPTFNLMNTTMSTFINVDTVRDTIKGYTEEEDEDPIIQ